MKKSRKRERIGASERAHEISRRVLGGDVLLSTEELAAMLRKPVSWVWNRRPSELPARTQLGARTIFYRASDVRAWIEARTKKV